MVGQPECHSAFARLRRENLFTRIEESQARQVLAQLENAWTEIAPGNELRDNASRALSTHPLRAADSLQLAAALVWAGGNPTGFEFVRLDNRLREAADREGFSILPAPWSSLNP